MTTLVLTLIGDDRSGLVNALAAAVVDQGGNWERSQLAELAGAFAGIVVVEVPDERTEALKAAVTSIDGLTVTIVDADAVAAPEPDRRIHVALLGNDRPGIVKELSGVVADLGLSIEEMMTGTRDAPMAGGRLFEAELIVPITPGTDLDALRGALERLADELMVDITLEDDLP